MGQIDQLNSVKAAVKLFQFFEPSLLSEQGDLGEIPSEELVGQLLTIVRCNFSIACIASRAFVIGI